MPKRLLRAPWRWLPERAIARNEPQHLSLLVPTLTERTGAFTGRFRHILFAVYDTSVGQATFRAFADRFA